MGALERINHIRGSEGQCPPPGRRQHEISPSVWWHLDPLGTNPTLTGAQGSIFCDEFVSFQSRKGKAAASVGCGAWEGKATLILRRRTSDGHPVEPVSGVWPHRRLKVRVVSCGSKGTGLPSQDPGFCRCQGPVARTQR